METLQSLYNSEINFSISTFWDGGFDWKLGDEMNGFKATGTSDTLSKAIQELDQAARIHYPDSDYAKGTVIPWNLERE